MNVFSYTIDEGKPAMTAWWGCDRWLCEGHFINVEEVHSREMAHKINLFYQQAGHKLDCRVVNYNLIFDGIAVGDFEEAKRYERIWNATNQE